MKTMSQSTEAGTLNYISNMVYIYGYSIILGLGLFGNTFNIIMFATKLQNSVCALYLLVSDVSYIVNLLIYILPSIVQLSYGKNGTESFLVWCKLTNYTGDVCILISTFMLCCASVDRYFSTSNQVRYRRWSSMKVGKISVVTIIFLLLPFGIPDLIYWYIDNDYKLCMVEEAYWAYASYFLIPVMLFLIPLLILIVSGYKTYRNLQTAVHMIRPEAASNTRRRRFDRELARMVIVQIFFFLFQTVTFFIVNLYVTITFYWKRNDVQLAWQNLFNAIGFTIYITSSCTNFFIYYSQSETFRKDVKKMLVRTKVHDAFTIGTN